MFPVAHNSSSKISPLVSLAGHVVTGNFKDHPTFDNNHAAPAIMFWLVAVGLAIWANVQAIYERQLAFKVRFSCFPFRLSNLNGII